MTKALRIIAFFSGLISIVATVILCGIYAESAATNLKKMKNGIANRFANKTPEDEGEFDF